MSGRNVFFIFIVLALVFVASNSLFVIKETERGVLLRFGEVVKADLQPGLQFKIPIVNEVRKFDGRLLTVDSTPERFFTQEQKALIVDSYAKFRVAETAKFYTATNGEVSRATTLLAQRINNSLRNEVAVRTIQEVVSGERDELMAAIIEDLSVVAQEQLGVEVVDVREHRSQGQELAEGIRAAADREVTVLKANAYRDSELIRGEGDASATAIYADAFNQDSEFYSFTRSLRAYQDAFRGNGDIMLLQPDSEFFRYLKDSSGGK
jgi:membrane protease subunit HflC